MWVKSFNYYHCFKHILIKHNSSKLENMKKKHENRNIKIKINKRKTIYTRDMYCYVAFCFENSFVQNL